MQSNNSAAPSWQLRPPAPQFDPFSHAAQSLGGTLGTVPAPPAPTPASPSPTPQPTPQSAGSTLANMLDAARDNTVAGLLSLPRSIAQGIDWAGGKFGLDPGASAALGSVPTPGDPGVPLFPAFPQAQRMAQASYGDQPFVPQTEGQRLGAAGLTGAMMALTDPAAIPAAAAGATTAQGVNDALPGHPVVATLAGLAAGAPAAAAARMTLPAVGGSLDAQTANLAQIAQQNKIPLGLGQLSNSPFVKYALSGAAKIPFSGSNWLADAQQTAFNRAVAKTFGEDASKITDEVLTNAKNRIGGVFQKVAAQTAVPVDNDLLSSLQGVLDRAKTTTTADNIGPIAANINNLINTAAQNNGVLTGRQFLSFTDSNSPLAGLMKNSQTYDVANDLKSVLDDAFQKNAPPQMQAQIAKARQQYAAMMTVAPLTLRGDTIGNALPSTGDISPTALLAAAAKGRPSAAFSPTDLVNLGRIGQRFLKEPQDSGTANRELINHLAGIIPHVVMTAAGAGGGAEAGGLEGAMAGLATAPIAIGVGRAANAILNNQTLAKRAIQGSLNKGGFQYSLAPLAVPAMLPQFANAGGAPTQ